LKAIKNAIEYCIENNILKEYLEKHGSEAYNMIFSEWNWDTALEVAHEEGREDGLEEGIEKEKIIIAKNLLEEGATIEFVQRVTGLFLEKIEELTNP
jgi:predicted transposase/invertase (TIGR01784 family)